MTSRHYVYLLECADGSLYTGYTTDLERRLDEHNDGTGAKYTRARLPVDLSYAEVYESRSAAMRREYEIKQQSHDEKRQLIDGDRSIDLPDVSSGGTGP